MRFCLRTGLPLLFVVQLWASPASANTAPNHPGKLVDLGGHRLHVHCTGHGRPTVVVENGLGDFSFDWSQVSRFTRICTYDRAGYAWSDPGPKPRTFAQLNLELRDALTKIGEPGPYLLVGHSFGGPVVRNFALTYPPAVAGIVFVDSAFEGQRVGIGGKATMRLGEDAKGKPFPVPRETIALSDRPARSSERLGEMSGSGGSLNPLYNVLPPVAQRLHLWAQAQPPLYDAEESQREWSSETFAVWLAKSQAGTLGSLPVIVLARAVGGYRDGATDISAAQLEAERKQGQAMLALLSSNSKLLFIASGHNMELESPQAVANAIQQMTIAIGSHHNL